MAIFLCACDSADDGHLSSPISSPSEKLRDCHSPAGHQMPLIICLGFEIDSIKRNTFFTLPCFSSRVFGCGPAVSLNEAFLGSLLLYPIPQTLFAPVNKGFGYSGPPRAALDLILT
jgi:hypothetical protein